MPDQLKEWHPDWVIDGRGVSGLKISHLLPAMKSPTLTPPKMHIRVVRSFHTPKCSARPRSLYLHWV